MTAPVAAPAPSADPVAPAAPAAAPVAAPVAAEPALDGLDGIIKGLQQTGAVVPGGDLPGEDAVEGDAPAGEGEESPAEETEQVKPAEFLRELPIPGRVDPATGKQEFSVKSLKLPDEQTSDAIGFHVKQSARVPILEQELVSSQQDRATIDFFDQKPVEGFTYLAELKPNAAKAWVSQYARAYPDVLAAVLAEAGYEVKPTADPRALAAEAQIAQRDLRDASTRARAEHEKSAASQTWTQSAGSLVREIGSTIGLEATTAEFRLFAQAAAVELDAKFPQGGASREQMVLTLQPLAQKAAQFLRTSPSTAPVVAALATPETKVGSAASPSTPAPNTGAALDAKSRQADKFRKLGGGAPSIPTAFTPPAAANQAETLEDYAARLQTI